METLGSNQRHLHDVREKKKIEKQPTSPGGNNLGTGESQKKNDPLRKVKGSKMGKCGWQCQQGKVCEKVKGERGGGGFGPSSKRVSARSQRPKLKTS